MKEIEEIWKPIDGFPGYFVSNFARVRTDKYRKRILKPQKKSGYLWVGLLDEMGKSRLRSIHHLVADAFIPNPDNKPEVDHINTIRDDNRLENLRWATRRENCRNELSLQKYRARVSPRKGVKLSEETKKKLSIAHKGKKFGEEYKAKMREDYACGKRRVVNKRPVALYDKDGILIGVWESARKASMELGICPSSICQCAKGIIVANKKGQVWKYYEER